MVREHAPAGDHETGRLGCEGGERVGGFDRESVLVDVAAGDRPQALGRGHVTPHVVGRGPHRPAYDRCSRPPIASLTAPDTTSTPQRGEQIVEPGERGRVRGQPRDVSRHSQPPVSQGGLCVRGPAGQRNRGHVVGLEAHVGRFAEVGAGDDRAGVRVEHDPILDVTASGHAVHQRLDHQPARVRTVADARGPARERQLGDPLVGQEVGHGRAGYAADDGDPDEPAT